MVCRGNDFDDVFAEVYKALEAPQPTGISEDFEDMATTKFVPDPAAPVSEIANDAPTKPHSFHTLGAAVDQGAMTPRAALETFVQISARRHGKR